MSNSVTNGSTTPDKTFGGRAKSRDYRTDMPSTETFGGERKLTMAGTREQTACRFCRRRIKYIDYKDVETLQKLLTNRGKIYSRKRSGNCAKCQRKAKKAIKRARYMALLPFTA